MARTDPRRDLDDDAPWLAEASPRAETHVSKRSLFWTVVVLLGLVAAAVIGGIIFISKKDAGSTQGYMEAGQAPLIEAEPGPYKVPPLDPKGLEVEGQDQTLYAAGEGNAPDSVIDQSAMPEAPLPRPGTPAPGLPRDLVPEATGAPVIAPPPVATAPVPFTPGPPTAPVPRPEASKPATPAPLAKPVATPPAKPNPTPPAKPTSPPVAKPSAPPVITAKPAARSGSVQLGAFSSEAKADAAWAGLAARHGLSGKRIIAVESGGKTLYRLRAASADTAATCARMKAAGDACAAVEP